MKEKPDSVLPTLGGQAALNLAMELEERGFFKEHNVDVYKRQSKNTVNTGEKYVISVDINEIIDYPYDYPYDFPVSCTRKAEPKK